MGKRIKKPYQYMPWCEQRFSENQEKITAALRKIAAEEQLDTVPVGDVWQEFQRIEPSVSLYWTDGEHAYAVVRAAAFCVLVQRVASASSFTVGCMKSIYLLMLKRASEYRRPFR